LGLATLLPHGDGSFQIIKRVNDNSYELDLSNTYLESNSFNVSDQTLFSTGVANSWTVSLPPEEHDEDLRDRTSSELAQPSRGMTWSMTQNSGLGHDHPLVSASTLIIPQRITRSRAHMMEAEHQLVFYF